MLRTKKFLIKGLVGSLILSSSVVVYGQGETLNYQTEVMAEVNTGETMVAVDQFVRNARKICADEMSQAQVLDGEDGEETIEPSFLYQYVDEASSLVYIYENMGGNEAVSVAEYVPEMTPYVSTDLPKGFGGRQYIKANGSTYISGTIALPNPGTLKATGTPYIYTGFTGGTKEADMGLQWSNNNGNTGTEGWKPYAKVGSTIITDSTSNFVPGYEQVTYKNSYLPGKTVDFYVYANYNNTGKVRMKTMGYARYANNSGTGTNSFLTSIVEYATSVGTPTSFKVLATVAGSDNYTGSFVTTVSNVKLNDAVPSSSAYLAPEEDYCKIARSGNTITFTVNK